MRRRVLGLLVLALPLLLAPVVASAQYDFGDDDARNEYVREGPFVTMAGVGAITHDVHPLSPDSGGGGLDFSVGFRLSRQISLAVTGIYMRIEGENVWGIGSNVKLYPVEIFASRSLMKGQLQPYLLGTAGFLVAGFKGNGRNEPGGSFGIGGGADFYLTEDLALFGQISYTGNGGDANALRTTQFELGLLARF